MNPGCFRQTGKISGWLLLTYRYGVLIIKMKIKDIELKLKK